MIFDFISILLLSFKLIRQQHKDKLPFLAFTRAMAAESLYNNIKI